MSTKQFEAREFLGREGLSAVQAEVVGIGDDGFAYISSFVSISDGSRGVQLDFSISSRSDRKTQLAALDTLVDVLTDTRDALHEASKNFVEDLDD